jgi:hypothetical protein
MAAAQQEVKACEAVVNLFANAVVERNYQLAYSLTSNSYQTAVRFDAFVSYDQEMQASTGGRPNSWEVPKSSRLLADSGQESLIVFRSRFEDGTTGAYATYVTFDRDQEGKCRLEGIEFSPWEDMPQATRAPYNDPGDTAFDDSRGEDE